MMNKDENGEPKTITMSLKETLKVLFVLFVGMPLCAFFTMTLLLVPYKTWGPSIERWSRVHPIASNISSAVLFGIAMTFSIAYRPEHKCKYEKTNKETT